MAEEDRGAGPEPNGSWSLKALEAQEGELGGVAPPVTSSPLADRKSVMKKDGKLGNGSGNGKDTGDKEAKRRPSPTTVVKLFRYARPVDFVLMIVASLASVIHGMALPIIMINFGDLVNGFINQLASEGFAVLTGGVVNCSATLPNDIGRTLSEALAARNVTFPGVNCSLVIMETTTFTDVLTMCSAATTCLTDAAFFAEINRVVFIFLGIGIAIFIVAYFQISFFQLACERQVHKIRTKFYRAVLRQNVGWFDANPSGELSSRLSDDIQKIHDGIGDKLALFLQWISTFVTGFVVAFVFEWRLTLLLIAFTPFMVISGVILSKLTALFASQEQKQYAGAGAVAEEVLGAIRTVVSFGGEQKEITRYNTKLKQARLLGAKKGFSVGAALAFVFFFLFLMYAIAFWFGAFLISTGVVQGGDILTTFFVVLIGAFSLGQAAPNLENLMTAAGAAEAIFETIDRTPPIDSSSDEGMILEEFDSTIEFNKVHFTYPTRPDVEVLTGVSLRVNVGETVALVGPSGCGKSTVIQLLQRFYDVNSGEVLVGGKDVRSLNIKWLRRNIGVVSQEPVLFDTTIAENIRFGREDATIEDIQQAAKSANAFDFITELPNGFDTLVGVGGTQMSGGQKQRIAIARALVRNPKILLLDEATSALDTESEAIVQEALDKAREGRTTIVVAHRLSTIQTADIIIAVEDGCVVEAGSHSELMDKEGLYYELVTAQSFAVDEGYLAGNVGRHLSPRKKRLTSGSESRPGFQHQVSFDKQTSILSERGVVKGAPRVKRQLSKKQEEELDKEIPKVSLFRVIKVNAPEWYLICLGLVGATINAAIFPAFAILFGEILTVFALPRNEVINGVHTYAGLFVMIAVVSAIAHFTKTFCFSVSGENLTARLRALSFRAMLRQEIGWFDDEKNSTGALTTRLANDAGQVQGVTGSRLALLIESNIALILALVIAFVFSWPLTLVIIGVVPIIVVAGALNQKALTGHALRSKKSLEEAGKVAVDSIENIRTVASLGVEDIFYGQFQTNIKAPYKLALRHTIVYGITYGFSQFFIYLMYGIVFRFGAYQVTLPQDHLVYEEFQNIFRVFFAIVFGALSLGQASTFAPDYAKARLSANRIFALIDRIPLIDIYSEEGDTPDDVSGAVEVNEVKFNYPSRPDVEVLKGLSLSVEPGKTLALVGPSGCGKSTIVSLIERFYDPSAGSLSVDGRSLGDLNIKWLRSQIGLVSQEPVLFDTSIADNIRYGANFREVSDEEIIEAAKAANIHSFIETLPEGYSTNVGAKGTQMSGGQKQRIAIARALVRNPKILLLDEATSALDTESEKIVQEALDKAREGRTSVVIAHRLSTIYGSDCIAVIQEGNVVEKGTHSSLLALKGVYYQLNRFQMIEEDAEASRP